MGLFEFVVGEWIYWWCQNTNQVIKYNQFFSRRISQSNCSIHIKLNMISLYVFSNLWYSWPMKSTKISSPRKKNGLQYILTNTNYHEKDVLIVHFTSSWQIGHFLMAGAQSRQQTRCPHGRNATATGFSVHILQVKRSFCSSYSLSTKSNPKISIDRLMFFFIDWIKYKQVNI
jgi:hypothetical protein